MEPLSANARLLTLPLRTTLIASHCCAGDCAVVWRSISIGRIRKTAGAAHDGAAVVVSPARQAAGRQ